MRGNGRLSPGLAAALIAIIAALIAIPITAVTGFIPAAHSAAQKLGWIAGLLALVFVLGAIGDRPGRGAARPVSLSRGLARPAVRPEPALAAMCSPAGRCQRRAAG